MNTLPELGTAPIRLLRKGALVAPLVQELELQPQLWGQNTFRTAQAYGNPHAHLSDIIVRFNHWKHWKGDRAKFNERHESVWWAPYEQLPAIKPLVFDLMRLFEAEALGMVLITQIPPHTTCERHKDIGWHAQQYVKFAVQLKAQPEQRFCFDGYELATEPGDLFAFDNSQAHWVTNPTDTARWTLIICLRLKQPTCLNCTWKGE